MTVTLSDTVDRPRAVPFRHPALVTLDDDPGAVTVPAPPATAPAAASPAVPAAPLTGAAAGGPEAAPVDLERLAAAVSERLDAGRDAPSPLHAFRGFGHFFAELRSGRIGDPIPALAAFADQVTTNNPGVILPTWITDVKGIVDRGARVITALGGFAALPESGMSVDWPFYDGDMDALVDTQAVEATDVVSVRVDIKRGSTALVTYAGGSTISWQLLAQSAPSYLEAYLRIMMIAYLRRVDKAHTVGLAAVAGGTVDLALVDGLTAKDFKAAIFDASSQVDDAVGTPATAILVSPDVWKLLGGLEGLESPKYGTVNVAGTAEASTLRIDVSGLPVTRAAYLDPATAVVTNPDAAQWHGQPPIPADADSVLKLSRDVAVWGLGAHATYVPAGVVKIAAVPVGP